ncbi:hypothetical protein PACTADRAFT_48516 [Pachysolen tannophilus NRRL Y-2460]|uniref:Uncharacterized protein n=1 Tax=Pachysolen tannophilus NRRL Y-2460 TaxID=669874 RepID=A0A1E4TY89_PACTA|nr:hypothetical protein PACTADRAFT_48516 [Pachysolen tannophilus NRRL Y-2460]
MNNLINYTSSSDGEEENILDKKIELPKPNFMNQGPSGSGSNGGSGGDSNDSNNNKVTATNRVLGGGLKNTFIDSAVSFDTDNIVLKESDVKITDFVPSSMRKKKKGVIIQKTDEKLHEDKKPTTELDLKLDLFGDTSKNNTKRRTDFAKLAPSVASINYGKPNIESSSSIQHETHKEKKEEINFSVTTSKDSRKRQKIDESKLIDFNVDKFYEKNNEAINKGELSFEDLQRQNKKLKFYNSSGKNQLNELIKFNEQNTDKLSDKFNTERSLKQKIGKKYGF